MLGRLWITTAESSD